MYYLHGFLFTKAVPNETITLPYLSLYLCDLLFEYILSYYKDKMNQFSPMKVTEGIYNLCSSLNDSVW